MANISPMPETVSPDPSSVLSGARGNEEIFRTLGEAVADILWMCDARGRPLYENPAWCRFTGKTHVDMLTGSWQDDYHPEDLPGLLAMWKDLAHDSRPAEYEARMRRYDGVYRWFSARVMPVRDEVGDVCRWVAVMTDIHERRLGEERQAFLLQLGDAIRSLVDPLEVQTTSCRLLAEFLGANRASLVDIQNDHFTIRAGYTQGVGPFQTTGSLAIFGASVSAAFRRGETVIVEDITTDDRFTPQEKNALIASQTAAFVGVMLLRDAEWVGAFGVDFSTPHHWTEAELRLIREVAERVWTTTERARAEEALRSSEEKYRTLFDSIDEGFCLVQMLFDSGGHPVDYRFLETNPAFEKQTGLQQAEGRTILELNPTQERHWFDTYGRIARTGRPERFENRVEALDRIFDVYAFRVGAPGSHQVAILFNDISERKRRESHLSFLADLSERLIHLSTATQTMRVIGELVGRFFDASACAFIEVDSIRDQAVVLDEWRRRENLSLIGRYRLSDYMTRKFFRDMAEGITVAVSDVADDPYVVDSSAFAALDIGAYLNVPLTRAGRWSFTFAVHHDKPHVWRPDEIALLEETFSRAWNKLERVRAEEALAADLRATQILRDLAVKMTTGAEFSALFEEINEAAIALTAADAGTVQVFNPATRHLHLIATRGFPPDSPQRFGEIDADSATSCGIALAAGHRIFLDFDDPSIDDPKGDLLWHREAGYLSAQSTPLIARSGRPIGMLSTHWRRRHRPTEWQLRHIDLLARQAADLIEQREAAEQIRENEERLRTLFNSMGEGFLVKEAILNAEGRPVDYLLVESNPAFSTHTGLDDPRGRRLLELIPDLDLQWMARCERVLSTGHTAQFEGYVGSLDRWLSVSAARLGGPESRRIAIVFSDITQRRESETMLMEALNETEQARADAETASKAKDHFLAILSHELRTPLTPVVFTTSALMRRTDLEPVIRRGVEMIDRNIQTECRLIDDLLDVTRIGRGRMDIERQPLDLHDIIRAALEVSEPDLSRKNQKLTVELDARHTRVTGDATRLKQAVWNLLKNASKFTPAEGAIHLSTTDSPDGVRMQLSDNGIGIPPEKLATIFQAFAQADESVSQAYGGLGLGLAIVKATAEAHGGTIEAHSHGPGQGSVFTFALPVGQA